ncbi:phage tail protein [Methyloversatilis sp.]|uniref:phage tail protein n=1 Tax=Methyloversatilis sp. TaxID=2569862 RepID=UPI0035AEB3BC
MAEVAVAALAGFGGSAVSGYIGTLVGSQFVGALVGAVASSAISSVVGGALGLNKKPKVPQFSAAAQDRQQMIRSAVATRQIVYGQAVVSGPIVFASSSGSNNRYLHVVIPLAGHECEAITSVWFGDELVGTLDGSGNVTTGRFAGKMRVKKHLGTAAQTVDTDLDTESTEWTVDHRLRGITYLYVRLEYDATAYPAGLENIKALVQGKKLYDPRTATTAWSDNWALVMRDYLASAYGLNATAGEIDDAAIITAANICDETVTTPGAGSESRYTCNGTVDTGSTPMANLRGLLTAGAGKLIYSQGVYVLHAGAFVSPTVTLDEDDLRGAIAVQARTPRQDLFNRVRGTFVSPDNFWQPSDFTPVGNSTYETQDGGLQITRDIELPYTITSFAAQRLAKIALERGRQGIVVTMPCKLTAFKVRAGDYINLTIAQLGWSAKPFSVTTWRMTADGGIDLELREEAAATYSWSSGEATVVDPAPDTNLPSLTYVAPPTSLVAYSGATYQLLDNGITTCRIYCEWTHTVDSQSTYYELQWQLDGDTEWSSAVVSASTRTAYIAPVQPGVDYLVRVRAVNVRGSLSAWEGPDLIAASADAPSVSVDYADITGDKPAPGATADLALIATGSCVITGNTAVKVGGVSAWDSSVYSRDAYHNGAYATFICGPINSNRLMVGLNGDPTANSSFDTLDHAIYTANAGELRISESGSTIYTHASPYTEGDVVGVFYDGEIVRYALNGVFIHTTAIGPNKRFYLDSAFLDPGATVTGLKFGPLGSTRQALERGTSITSGGITFNAGGAIKGGQTAFNVGTGWFLGYEGGFYKFSVGSGSGNRLTFDQSTGEIELVGKVSGQLIQTVRSEAASNATINTSWTILQGFPVTVQGSKVVIDIAVFQANGTCKYRVLRDTTVLAYWPATGNFVGNHWITHRIEDSPAPGGLHTYFLEAIQSSGSGTGLAQERSLRVEDWR